MSYLELVLSFDQLKLFCKYSLISVVKRFVQIQGYTISILQGYTISIFFNSNRY